MLNTEHGHHEDILTAHVQIASSTFHQSQCSLRRARSLRALLIRIRIHLVPLHSDLRIIPIFGFVFTYCNYTRQWPSTTSGEKFDQAVTIIKVHACILYYFKTPGTRLHQFPDGNSWKLPRRFLWRVSGKKKNTKTMAKVFNDTIPVQTWAGPRRSW